MAEMYRAELLHGEVGDAQQAGRWREMAAALAFHAPQFLEQHQRTGSFCDQQHKKKIERRLRNKLDEHDSSERRWQGTS